MRLAPSCLADVYKLRLILSAMSSLSQSTVPNVREGQNSTEVHTSFCRSQGPRGLRHQLSSPARTLES
jgi:hypothetical protein